ncbi:MAG: DUF3891 family protein [Coleofasciculus sp. B1-GNL1-01]|uniref:DUF3891 family protein n=1 Tax=Coleofasciculus sp. B1-GNL1-01 TaxID=3068484 RepID=UPI0033002099
MLHRSSKEGLICITQPNHAWVSGELARAWGNEQFGQFVPPKELCLAAEQHDIGWLLWEQAPTLNPETGYPYRFTELPTQVHIDIWTGAKQLAMPWGRYVTLFVSLHGTGLYERYQSWQKNPESSRIVQDFLNSEYAFQEQLIATLKNDPHYVPYVTPEIIKRNQKLVATWDAISLILCQNVSGEQQVEQVPTAEGETVLTLTHVNDDPHQIILSPWPLQENEVTLVYEGRLLRETFTDEMAMREALRRDGGLTLTTILTPE